MNIKESRKITKTELQQLTGNEYKIISYGTNYSVFLMGEQHGDESQEKKPIELIDLIRPEYVLHEITRAWIYDPTERKYKPRDNRRFYEYELEDDAIPSQELINASNRLGFKLIGCDLTDVEINDIEKEIARKNPDVYEYVSLGKPEDEGVLRKKSNPNFPITSQDPEIIPFRDRHMADMTISFRRISQRPIITIVGSFHATDIHKGKLLQQKGFDYVWIDPIGNKQ